MGGRGAEPGTLYDTEHHQIDERHAFARPWTGAEDPWRSAQWTVARPDSSRRNRGSAPNGAATNRRRLSAVLCRAIVAPITGSSAKLIT